jgi:hypothetical protein
MTTHSQSRKSSRSKSSVGSCPLRSGSSSVTQVSEKDLVQTTEQSDCISAPNNEISISTTSSETAVDSIDQIAADLDCERTEAGVKLNLNISGQVCAYTW